ncbi:MAG: hypothetical protein ABL901_11855 [Hyphomicrobiaceae bacterium]
MDGLREVRPEAYVVAEFHALMGVNGVSHRLFPVEIESRPLNCGTYKYWDGDTCADARDR